MEIFKELEQGTKEWYEARAGLITGTRLERVISSRKDTREKLIHELIGEKIVPLQDIYQSDIMERGHLLESVVKELYTKEKIESVGFIRRDSFVGISPDGIIYRDGKIVKAVEIKGPMPTNFVKYWLSPDTIPSEYFWQVVHYFIVIDTLEEIDFVIHNPDPKDERARTIVIHKKREDLQESINEANVRIAEFQVELTNAIRTFVSNVEAHGNTIKK